MGSLFCDGHAVPSQNDETATWCLHLQKNGCDGIQLDTGDQFGAEFIDDMSAFNEQYCALTYYIDT